MTEIPSSLTSQLQPLHDSVINPVMTLMKKKFNNWIQQEGFAITLKSTKEKTDSCTGVHVGIEFVGKK